MEFITEMLTELLRTIPFLLICLIAISLNLKKRERAHQFLMPIAAALYCVPVALFTDWFAELLDTLITNLIGILALIPALGPVLEQWLNSLVQSIKNNIPEVLLYNGIIMLAFCLIKLILRPILRRNWSRFRWIGERTAGRFYRRWDAQSVLYQKYGDVRRLLKVLYIATLILGWLDCALILLNSGDPFFGFPNYPVFGIILLGEIFFFLNGSTPDESGDSDEEDPEMTDVKCGAILNALQRTFGDRLGYSDQRMAPANREPKADWEAALEDGDNLDQVTSSYFQAIRSTGQELNPDYVTAADKLLHGQSVLIYNPFYHDMTDYIMLPIYHALLNHQSCLIICGRSGSEQDVQAWIKNCMVKTTNLPKLWNVEILDRVPDEKKPAHIGILGFRRIFDLENLRENKEFFQRTSLVIMLEPSNLLGTGQIGLRSTLQFCEDGDQKPVYCILDRNVDGLVDALSHVAYQSITEVVASPTPQSGYCRAFWRAEGPGMQTRVLDGVSHYLGVGGEIATLAVSEGARVMHWYSGHKMALTDMKWNIEQYYAPICRFLNVPEDQVELDAVFNYHENLWQADFGPRSFVLVEDEFCNAFEMERAFGARVRDKGFINVLSESYMLRDYMYSNNDILTNDPKAIPSIAPDYARTERNFILRTLMMMAIQPIEESALSEQLALRGIETSKVHTTLKMLAQKHTGPNPPEIHTCQSEQGRIGIAGFTRYAYYVDQAEVNKIFDSALRIAYYVIENETTGTYLIGNRLMDHVEQIMLPGQFFCYDGRYYQVRSISRVNGIVVRRAADHMNGRLYYRQLRRYRLKPSENKVQIYRNGKELLEKVAPEVKNFHGIRIVSLHADIEVQTPAYLEMSCRNDLPNANYVELDARGGDVRKIYHKEVLRLEFADTAPEVRFTLCVLLNELFQTVYPNDFEYITVCMPDVPEHIRSLQDYESRISSVVPTVDIENESENSIYIIEDSNIDLGLLVSCERNLQRFFEILADYLDWYTDPARSRMGVADTGSDVAPPETLGDSQESAGGDLGASAEGPEKDGDADTGEPDDPGVDLVDLEGSDDSKDDGSKSEPWYRRLWSRLFKRKKKPQDGEANPLIMRLTAMKDHELDDVDGEDEEIMEPGSGKKNRHAGFEYLTFGYGPESEPEWLELKGTLDYLTGKGFLDSNLHRAHRKADLFDDDSDYDPTVPGTHYCDFCGRAIEIGEFEVLKDGRERCPECSKDAVRTRKQFKQVYLETIKEMEQVFQISFRQPIKARMSNAKEVNEGLLDYKASPGFDARVAGYAQGNKIVVENGAPRWKMKQTLVHELTHIWQHENWDSTFLSRYEQDEYVTMTMEGMAVWAEIQYLLSMGEEEQAIRYKRNRDNDPSVYGTGMRRYLDKYPPKKRETVKPSQGPFFRFPPI